MTTLKRDDGPSQTSQMLYRQVEKLQAENASLRAEVAALRDGYNRVLGWNNPSARDILEVLKDQHLAEADAYRDEREKR